MPVLTDLTARLSQHIDLTAGEIDVAAAALADPLVVDDSKVAFLRALGDKGETAAELAAFAKAFRARALDPGVESFAAEAIDIVGTGGDHTGAFNISSLVVLTLACAGVPVMKHGNRGITSKCGSADLLGGLGFKLDAPPEKLRAALAQLGYVFFFAPAFHPAFKHIAPARKALAAEGRRSVFNVLGPLINPGRPAHVLLGVFSAGWTPLMADTLERLGAAGGIAVHGSIDAARGVDELTTATDTRVRGFGRNRNLDTTWTPEGLGLRRADFGELLGGDLAHNLALVDALLAGKGPSGLADTIALNAAVALWICGRAGSPVERLDEARGLLLGGAVKARIAATREFFLTTV
ncbi:MAG: anthranilate phosphoribosyltransferase [Opitutaceae bacterium]|jgi:anthranilate phosphoribosyltransferase|nr:anthranilate phosphoribosyltransferase [Opitutaceae bacterium]